MQIKIIKSPKRRRTSSARLRNDVLEIRVPDSLSEKKIETTVEWFKKSFERKKKRQSLDNKELAKRAKRLNKKYFEGKLKYDVCWSVNQDVINGSCTHRKRTIRISHKLAKVPKWVLDYVIVHELAHLKQPNHSKAFWDLVNQYHLTERARGYLMGMGVEVKSPK